MKEIKTRVIGLLMIMVVLFSGTVVFADIPESDDPNMLSASSISYGQTVHVSLARDQEGKWYRFTPSEGGNYRFVSSNNHYQSSSFVYDTEIYLFDSDGDQLDRASGNLDGVFSLERFLGGGKTYYIWLTADRNVKQAGSFDLTLTWGCSQFITVDGITERTSEYTVFDEDFPEMTLSVTYSGSLSYSWWVYDFFEDRYERIPGATSNSFVISEPYEDVECVVDYGAHTHSYRFRIKSRSYTPSFSEGIVNILANRSMPTLMTIPEYTGAEGPVRFCVFPGYGEWYERVYHDDYDEIWYTDQNGCLPLLQQTTIGSIYATEEYRSYSYAQWWSTYVPANETVILAFVPTEQNSDTLTLNESKEVTLSSIVYDEYEYYPGSTVSNRIASECMVYSFTPPASGTYTIRSSDIVTGDPYVALFSEGHRCLGYADNIDGRAFFEEHRSDLEPSDRNFALTARLEAGETYYYAVWTPTTVNEDDFSSGQTTATTARYTVNITADSIDPVNVSVTSDGHGSASASAGSAVPGTEIILTAVPDNGYHLASWEVLSGGVTITDNRFTVEYSGVEIRAHFEADPAASSSSSSSSTVVSTPTPAIPSNPNPSSSSAQEPGVGGFVERLYTIALGRASDPTGKQDWIDAITLRGETGAGAARGFLFSPEFLNKDVTNEQFVAVLYRTFFNREPDQAGFNAWVDVLNNGTSKQEVIEGFINSTEWANLCLFYGIRSGGTGVPNVEMEPNQMTIDFATRLYTTCLGRNADQAGLMAWARQLANQRDTGTGAARGFFFSNEFTGQNVSNGEFVTRLYRTFMNREPDQAGYDAWVAQLDGGVSREEVFNGFSESIEFARICASYGIVR